MGRRIMGALIILAIALLAAACMPEFEVVIYADSADHAEMLSEGVRMAAIELDAVAQLRVRVEWIPEAMTHSGHPSNLEMLSHDGQFSVYAMDSITTPDGAGAVGVANRAANHCDPTIGAIPESFDARIAAHELGHTLGLPHDDARHNLMALHPLHGASFSAEQVDIMAETAEWMALNCGI